jgi:hypothetical protein
MVVSPLLKITASGLLYLRHHVGESKITDLLRAHGLLIYGRSSPLELNSQCEGYPAVPGMYATAFPYFAKRLGIIRGYGCPNHPFYGLALCHGCRSKRVLLKREVTILEDLEARGDLTPELRERLETLRASQRYNKSMWAYTPISSVETKFRGTKTGMMSISSTHIYLTSRNTLQRTRTSIYQQIGEKRRTRPGPCLGIWLEIHRISRGSKLTVEQRQIFQDMGIPLGQYDRRTDWVAQFPVLSSDGTSRDGKKQEEEEPPAGKRKAKAVDVSKAVDASGQAPKKKAKTAVGLSILDAEASNEILAGINVRLVPYHDGYFGRGQEVA